MKKKFGLYLLAYFRFWAKAQLKKNPRAVLIGVTGSAGKTSTRLAIVKILSARGKVKNSAHANSESGIPLNILGLSARDYSGWDWMRLAVLAPVRYLLNWEKFDYYVAEMGIDSPRSPKNMAYLLSILRPHVAVVLNAGITHAAEFDFLVKDRNPVRRLEKVKMEIAKEKMKLAQGIDPAGVAIVNYDQPELKKQLNSVKARVITFGEKTGSAFRIGKIKIDDSFSMDFSYQTREYRLLVDALLEPAYARSFASAICVGIALGIEPAESVAALKTFAAPKGRLVVLRGVNGSTIIDSSYNASPDTMSAALAFLKKTAGRRYKLAILGDMRELGAQSKLTHKFLADWIRKYSDECILFGPLTGEYTYPYLKRLSFPVRHFTVMDELTAYARSRVKKGAWILVKGSQNNIFLERAVESLLADPSDVAQLPRRGRYWDKVRSAAA